MIPDRPVLVAGAGIAGLTFALACAARGLPCRVIERAERLEDIGAGIQLPPNAARILARYGLDDALDARAVRPGAVAFIDAARGGVLARMPLGAHAIERWGASSRVLHRADLQHVLLRAVEAAGVPIALGHRLMDARDTGDRVVATIATPNGTGTMEAAALIGADGVRSRVRALMGDPDEPRFSGHIAWRALAPAETLPPALRTPETGLWLGPRAHLVHYPVSGGHQVNIVAVTRGRMDESRFDPSIFQRWSKPAQQLVTTPESWIGWPLFTRPAHRPWTRGRMALIGDAAHAMLPHLAQGAAQGIEDAEALADAIMQAAAIGEAFTNYEQARKPRAARIQDMSRRNGGIYQMSAPLALARDLALRTLSPQRLMARMDWLYGRMPSS